MTADAEIVRELGDVREQLTDLDAALTVLAKLPRRLQQIAHAPLGEREGPLERERLPMVLRQPRFGVEGVHVGRPAVHEQEDHTLGARREMEAFGVSGSAGSVLARACSVSNPARPMNPNPQEACRSRCLLETGGAGILLHQGPLNARTGNRWTPLACGTGWTRPAACPLRRPAARNVST